MSALTQGPLNGSKLPKQKVELLATRTLKLDNLASQEPVQFAGKVIASVKGQKFKLISDTYETSWGFENQNGEVFHVSNRDMVTAFRVIVDNWKAWKQDSLHINSINPDHTFNTFGTKYFPTGGARSAAKVQRRGFLHLINAMAFSAQHDGEFNAAAWKNPLGLEDYKAALLKVQEFSSSAAAFSGPAIKNFEAAKVPQSARLTGAQNILYYGAPGTGKSHKVQQLIGTSRSFTTVFHPDMQNSDFIGSLKPGLDEKGGVTYAFRPGPFARALSFACANPSEKVYLVIEELNRAVAAAVFGELFQLLDRTKDGSGRYGVDFPSPEFEAWFAATLKEVELETSRLLLPSNLWILATMNSADQGVYPLDTAFRRRWVQEYVAINYENAPDLDVTCILNAGPINISWKTFVEALNRFLVSELDIGEDRLLGPRFVDEHELVDGALPGKLLIYLWDDLLRHHGRNELFAEGVKTYGEIDRRSKNKEPIFSTRFLSRLPGDNEPIVLDEN
jgi:hypothetical protein